MTQTYAEQLRHKRRPTPTPARLRTTRNFAAIQIMNLARLMVDLADCLAPWLRDKDFR
jgi:hypothetical protein